MEHGSKILPRMGMRCYWKIDGEWIETTESIEQNKPEHQVIHCIRCGGAMEETIPPWQTIHKDYICNCAHLSVSDFGTGPIEGS